MLSPVISQPSQTSLTQAQPSSGPQNGLFGDGAVQESVNTPDIDSVRKASVGRDLIRAGKEKAKAIMAASGVQLGRETQQNSSPKREKSPPVVTENTNGAIASRKRSRSGSRIPAQPTPHCVIKPGQSDTKEYMLSQYIERDLLHAEAMNQQSEQQRKFFERKYAELDFYRKLREQRQPELIFGYGYAGYGNGTTNGQTRLEYPAQRKRPGNRRSKPFHLSRKDATAQAEQLEELVPVRLDIEFDKIKLRDTFTWNLHDRVTSPEQFAENIVEDFKLPPETTIPIAHQINKEIHEQLQDFYPHVFIDEDSLDPHLPYFAYKNDEMRILVKLNITIGQHTLVDQFEWEINNPLNCPEEFARQMARDLSLSGEFTTAIAHSIREQSQMFTRSLYITGHPFDGRPVEDADVRESFLPSPLPSVFRPAQAAKDFAPCLYELNETELEKTELSILREQRRQKRSVNRRGGPALPDLKDRQRTVRTLIVSSVLPGAAETLEESRAFKISRSSGRGRRAVRTDGADDSDESESDDSAPESPAPSQLMMSGTARTRVIRGAATAAQAAMRANLGRSATPELSALHHETRTSRRLGGYDTREESVAEPTSLVVKLRISKTKLRQWEQRQKAGKGGELQQGLLSAPLITSQNNTPQRSTPATSMPPPPSPALNQRNTPAAASPRTGNSALSANGDRQWHYDSEGRVEAPPQPLPPGQPPVPPPAWLTSALHSVKERYPHDSFEAVMRHMPVDPTTLQPLRSEPGTPLPANVRYMYLPRIRCNDCPGKLYTAGPNLTVENFEVHLRNRGHKEKVDERRRKAVGA